MVYLILRCRKSVPLSYSKSDVDAFAKDLFQGIYSALEELERKESAKLDVNANPQPTTYQLIDQIVNHLEHIDRNQDILADGVARVLVIWRHVEENNKAFWPVADELMEGPDDLGSRYTRRVRDNLLGEIPFDDKHADLLEDTILDISDSILIPEEIIAETSDYTDTASIDQDSYS